MAALAEEDTWEDSGSDGGWEDDASDDDGGDGDGDGADEEALTAPQSLASLVGAFEIKTRRSFRTGEFSGDGVLTEISHGDGRDGDGGTRAIYDPYMIHILSIYQYQMGALRSISVFFLGRCCRHT
jgi:hypothetical protein